MEKKNTTQLEQFLCNLHQRIVETEVRSIPLTYIFMTTYSQGLVQTLKVAGLSFGHRHHLLPRATGSSLTVSSIFYSLHFHPIPIFFSAKKLIFYNHILKWNIDDVGELIKLSLT
jgi:hypothetical protein